MERQPGYSIVQGTKISNNTMDAEALDCVLRTTNNLEHFEECWLYGTIKKEFKFGVPYEEAAQLKLVKNVDDKLDSLKLMIFDEYSALELIIDSGFDMEFVDKVFCNNMIIMIFGRLEFDGKFYVEGFKVPQRPELSSIIQEDSFIIPQSCSLDSYKSLIKLEISKPYFVILNQPSLLKMDYRRLNRLKDFLVPTTNSPFKHLSNLIFNESLIICTFPKKFSSLSKSHIDPPAGMPELLNRLLQSDIGILSSIVDLMHHISSSTVACQPIYALTNTAMPINDMIPHTDKSLSSWIEVRYQMTAICNSANVDVNIKWRPDGLAVLKSIKGRNGFIKCAEYVPPIDKLLLISVKTDNSYLVHY